MDNDITNLQYQPKNDFTKSNNKKLNLVTPFVSYSYTIASFIAYFISFFLYLKNGGLSYLLQIVKHPEQIVIHFFLHTGNDFWDKSLYSIGAMRTSNLKLTDFLYRPIVSLFLNYSFFALIMSVLVFLLAGRTLERVMGHTKFLLITLIGGYCSNIVSAFTMNHFNLGDKIIASSSPLCLIILVGLISMGLYVYLGFYHQGEFYVHGLRSAYLLISIAILYFILVPNITILASAFTLLFGQILWLVSILISYLYRKRHLTPEQMTQKIKANNKKILSERIGSEQRRIF